MNRIGSPFTQPNRFDVCDAIGAGSPQPHSQKPPVVFATGCLPHRGGPLGRTASTVWPSSYPPHQAVKLRRCDASSPRSGKRRSPGVGRSTWGMVWVGGCWRSGGGAGRLSHQHAPTRPDDPTSRSTIRRASVRGRGAVSRRLGSDGQHSPACPAGRTQVVLMLCPARMRRPQAGTGATRRLGSDIAITRRTFDA